MAKGQVDQVIRAGERILEREELVKLALAIGLEKKPVVVPKTVVTVILNIVALKLTVAKAFALATSSSVKLEQRFTLATTLAWAAISLCSARLMAL